MEELEKKLEMEERERQEQLEFQMLSLQTEYDAIAALEQADTEARAARETAQSAEQVSPENKSVNSVTV